LTEPNAFDPDYLFPSLLIQITRTYDAIMALLRVADQEVADSLMALHEQGEFLSPPPSFREDNNGKD